MNHRRAGVLMFIVATLVAFSRLYLFVHFPTDVLCGIVLGIKNRIVNQIQHLTSAELQRLRTCKKRVLSYKEYGRIMELIMRNKRLECRKK